MIPAVRLQLERGRSYVTAVGRPLVLGAEGDLELVHGDVGVTHAQQENILNAHDRRNLLFERVAVNERFEREAFHVLDRFGLARPVGPCAVFVHVDHDVDQGRFHKDEIDGARTCEDLHAAGRNDRHRKHVTLLVFDRQFVELFERKGERLALDQPRPDDGRNLRKVVISPVRRKQLRRRIVVERPVAVEQFGSLGERNGDVLGDGLRHGDGDLAGVLFGYVERIAHDTHLGGIARGRNEYFVIEVVFALLVALTAGKGQSQKDAPGKSGFIHGRFHCRCRFRSSEYRWPRGCFCNSSGC